MDIPLVHTVNLSTVLSESKRIVKANYSHFFALSLFFLPLSLSLVITPTLHLHLSGNFFSVDFIHNFLSNNQTVVIFHILYILIVYLLTICAIGTTSYSTYNVLTGKPVNYFAALKSLTFSFLPLFSTITLAQILLLLISLTFLLFVGVIIMLAENLGFAIDYNFIRFTWLPIVLGVTLIYLHMNWCLASMVVVAESKWGFTALIRSWYLVKGMRSISLSLSLYFLIGNGLLAWFSARTVNVSAFDGHTQSVVFFTILCSLMLMMCLVASIAANTVLYMYCKAFHGELTLEIGEGFNHEYINLPADDEKVPHVVTVMEA